MSRTELPVALVAPAVVLTASISVRTRVCAEVYWVTFGGCWCWRKSVLLVCIVELDVHFQARRCWDQDHRLWLCPTHAWEPRDAENSVPITAVRGTWSPATNWQPDHLSAAGGWLWPVMWSVEYRCDHGKECIAETLVHCCSCNEFNSPHALVARLQVIWEHSKQCMDPTS